MKKRKTRFTGIIAMAVMVAVMLMPVGVQAASQKSMAIQAYKKFLSNATIPWEDDWKVRASRCSFALAYIDIEEDREESERYSKLLLKLREIFYVLCR